MDRLAALPGDALGAVNNLATRAADMAPTPPTFFDQASTRIVRIQDTQRGLVFLGLDETSARYAAYALHTLFSYPTSENWVPAFDKELPIHVKRMSRTRLGRNWGSFQRVNWVNDANAIDQFFNSKQPNSVSEYLNKYRHQFGVLLLIFEWGTTQPFYIPPGTDTVKSQIAPVVRKAILPGIITTYQASQTNPTTATTAPANSLSSLSAAVPKPSQIGF